MRYYQRLTLEFKTGTYVMPLIQEKIGVGLPAFIRTYVAPIARNFSRHDATKPQRSQRLFITVTDEYRE
jgi:hypothetical protein